MSRFTTFTATYRIVTPMFCGGAGQKAELRLSSFKGALRFWWRSLQWGKVKDEEELWQKEAELFGVSDQAVGQSKVRMRLVSTEPKPLPLCPNKLSDKLKGAHYLGYGVMNIKGEFTQGREAIDGGCFTVELRCGPNLDPSVLDEVQKSLVLLGTVGGLGSKSRKGYGSLTLAELKKGSAALELSHEPTLRLSQIVAALPDGKPDWSAWSTKSRVVTVAGARDPLRLLDSIGKELVHYRSWGREGKVWGQDREENFKEDHDLSKSLAVKIAHPKRVAFGLPHNYGKGTTNEVKPSSLDRRASPLFIHIHQVSAGTPPVGVLTFLPSLFLPDGEQLKSFGHKVDLDRSESFWGPIHGFLDRFLDKPGATTKKDASLKAVEVKFG